MFPYVRVCLVRIASMSTHVEAPSASMPKAVKVNFKHYSEATRAAVLATHSTASMLLGATKFQPQAMRARFLEAARLLRTAEGLARCATAILGAEGAAKIPAAGSEPGRTSVDGSPSGGTGPAARKKRRRRRKNGKQGMEVDLAGTADEVAGGISSPAPPQGPSAPCRAATKAPTEPRPRSLVVPPLFGGSALDLAPSAGDVKVVKGTGNPSINGGRCLLVSHGADCRWTVEMESTGEYVEVSPDHLCAPLFDTAIRPAAMRGWRGTAPTSLG